jgi:hypothetical protein
VLLWWLLRLRLLWQLLMRLHLLRLLELLWLLVSAR